MLLCLLPLFHIYSLNSVLLAGLRAGCAIVIGAGLFTIWREAVLSRAPR